MTINDKKLTAEEILALALQPASAAETAALAKPPFSQLGRFGRRMK